MMMMHHGDTAVQNVNVSDSQRKSWIIFLLGADCLRRWEEQKNCQNKTTNFMTETKTLPVKSLI